MNCAKTPGGEGVGSQGPALRVHVGDRSQAGAGASSHHPGSALLTAAPCRGCGVSLLSNPPTAWATASPAASHTLVRLLLLFSGSASAPALPAAWRPSTSLELCGFSKVAFESFRVFQEEINRTFSPRPRCLSLHNSECSILFMPGKQSQLYTST